jgi:hypothetical protein
MAFAAVAQVMSSSAKARRSLAGSPSVPAELTACPIWSAKSSSLKQK